MNDVLIRLLLLIGLTIVFLDVTIDVLYVLVCGVGFRRPCLSAVPLLPDRFCGACFHSGACVLLGPCCYSVLL